MYSNNIHNSNNKRNTKKYAHTSNQRHTHTGCMNMHISVTTVHTCTQFCANYASQRQKTDSGFIRNFKKQIWSIVCVFLEIWMLVCARLSAVHLQLFKRTHDHQLNTYVHVNSRTYTWTRVRTLLISRMKVNRPEASFKRIDRHYETVIVFVWTSSLTIRFCAPQSTRVNVQNHARNSLCD